MKSELYCWVSHASLQVVLDTWYFPEAQLVHSEELGPVHSAQYALQAFFNLVSYHRKYEELSLDKRKKDS